MSQFGRQSMKDLFQRTMLRLSGRFVRWSMFGAPERVKKPDSVRCSMAVRAVNNF